MGPSAIDKMLKEVPPKEPLTTLEAVWHDFVWRRLKQGHRDPCIAFTSEQESIEEAIEVACDSRGADGKLFFHQGRVWQKNRDVFASRLLEEAVYIENQPTFHHLFLAVEEIGLATPGIGPITIYDVTARIAAWACMKAQRVYLHGGVLDGARSLGIEPKNPRWIKRKELPFPLRQVDNLDFVEDFLCGYRVLIERIK